MTEEQLIEGNKLYAKIREKTDKLEWFREFIGNDSTTLKITLNADGKAQPFVIEVSNNEEIAKVLARVEKDLVEEIESLNKEFKRL